MFYREKLLETVILGLLKEIQYAVDNGKNSSEILEGDLWIDTKDRQQSINIDINWDLDHPTMTATAFPVKRTANGSLQEDSTAQEELFLELTT